MATKEKDTLGR